MYIPTSESGEPMDNNTLIIIAAVAVVGIVIGAIIGYLLGGKKDTGIEAEKAWAEARAGELEKQVKQKDIEISRRDDDIRRQQDKLVAAEGSKSEAKTKLAEAHIDITDLREQLEAKELERVSYRNAHILAEKKSVELEATNKAIIQQLAEQKQFLEDADVKLRDAFKALSSEALETNNSTFLHLAKQSLEAKVEESASQLEQRKTAIETLVKPLSESLKNFDGKLSEIELKREGAYSEMKTLVGAMRDTTERLETGTRSLVGALKTSHTRGRYGEIALRRLIESAGLMPYSDFYEQPSVETEDGRLRPDCAVNLPGHRQLILDSKVPLNAYLDAFETDVESEKIVHLKRHAAAVRDHFTKLSKKSYWEAFADAPDFVIMYMHIESSYGAALMTDTQLIEDGLSKNIIFATPSTLLAILRTAGYMWQQEKMAKSVIEMQNAGLELYKRTNKVLEYFSKVGNSLTSAVSNYNDAVGSVESRFMTHLEKIKEIGGTMLPDEIQPLKPVEISVRPVLKSIGSGETDEGGMH
ncbi:MAG: DNA recombination protein RmuC [Pyrinomonadaceae bacterium]